MPIYMPSSANILSSPPPPPSFDQILMDKAKGLESAISSAASLDEAFGPAVINEPQKRRWLSSLHSVIFIITCAMAIFIVFRNVLTW